MGEHSDETVERPDLTGRQFRITICSLDGGFCGFPGWEYECHSGTPQHGRTYLRDVIVSVDAGQFAAESHP